MNFSMPSGPRKGKPSIPVIDDSKKGKRGKKMEAAGWVYDPLAGKKIWGHRYIKTTILFRGYTIPFGIRLYVKKEKSAELEVEFKKLTHLAIESNCAQEKRNKAVHMSLRDLQCYLITSIVSSGGIRLNI
jgi:hypothetical protein